MVNAQLCPSLFWLHVHSCTHWLRPRNPPPPHLGSYTRALLVSQDRRHLFVTPCMLRTVFELSGELIQYSNWLLEHRIVLPYINV
jgi:hypothetical protein